MHKQHQQRSTDLHKPSFLAIEWHRRLFPDALGVVDGDVDPMPARPDHSRPIALAVLHPNEVLAKLEVLANFFLDHRAAERLACSWAFLSKLIDHVFPEMSLDVILLLDACRVELVLLLDACRVELVLGLDVCRVELVLGLDVCRVELVVLIVFDLDG